MSTTLPPESSGLKKITDKYQLYRLSSGKRLHVQSNMEPAIGTKYIIVSPYSNTRYVGTIHEHTNWDELEKYINEGNCYAG